MSPNHNCILHNFEKPEFIVSKPSSICTHQQIRVLQDHARHRTLHAEQTGIEPYVAVKQTVSGMSIASVGQTSRHMTTGV